MLVDQLLPVCWLEKVLQQAQAPVDPLQLFPVVLGSAADGPFLFILFYFILFYFILFYFILFYFILFLA
jgi:hypothetical protein